jgi:hypothetical protein
MEEPEEGEKCNDRGDPNSFDALCEHISLYCWQFMVSSLYSLYSILLLTILTILNTATHYTHYTQYCYSLYPLYSILLLPILTILNTATQYTNYTQYYYHFLFSIHRPIVRQISFINISTHLSFTE